MPGSPDDFTHMGLKTAIRNTAGPSLEKVVMISDSRIYGIS